MRRLIRRRLNLRSERGAALVEFALVVPFLMLMMCATIDFGLAVYTLNNLTAAVREGGRFAATMTKPGPIVDDPAVQTRVYNYIAGMNSSGLTPAQVKALIKVSTPDAITGNITVRILGYPYKPVTPLAIVFGLGTITLNRTAVFRWEMAAS
jgi:Flp pilus assembly protein TadG